MRMPYLRRAILGTFFEISVKLFIADASQATITY
jgi:hypothetical protein